MPADPEKQSSIDRWPTIKNLMRRYATKHRIGTDHIETEKDQAKRLKKTHGIEAQYRNGLNAGGYKDALDAVRNRQEAYHDLEQMSSDSAISGSIDIYADEASQQDTITRHTIQVEADDPKVKDELEKLLYQILKIDDSTWDIVRRIVINGDGFYEIKFRKDFRGVYGIQRLDHKKMDRVERDGKLIGFKVRKMNYDPKRLSRTTGWGIGQQNMGADQEDTSLSPFRIIHFRLPNNSDSVYGRSVLEPARRTWRQVRLMEDSIILYRLSRGAERRVFYINVGNLADDEAEGYLRNLIAKFRKKSFINPRTNEIDERSNPLAWDEDFFIPIQDGKDNTRVEQLPGGQNMSDIEDLKWFRAKIDEELKIPTAYKSRDGSYDTKAGLSQQDIRFTKTIERVQRSFLEGINKLCYIHLMMRQYTFKQITGFQLKMTPPSALADLLRLDALSAKLEIVGTAKSTEVLPDIWCLTEVMGFGEEEAEELLSVMAEQKQAAARAEVAAQGTAGGAGGMGAVGGAEPIPGAEGDITGAPPGAEGQDQAGIQGQPGQPQAAPGQPGVELSHVVSRFNPITEGYQQTMGMWLVRRKAQKAKEQAHHECVVNFEHHLAYGDFGGLDVKIGKSDLTKSITETIGKADNLIAESEAVDKLLKG